MRDIAMNAISSISRSGMQAAQTTLNVSANNTANANTEGYRRQQVDLTAKAEGGVVATVRASDDKRASLEADVLSQLQAKNAFLANLKVFKTGDAMAGALLDKTA